jgi:hypothetical protein
MSITHHERDCLMKYIDPTSHLQEKHGKTLINLLKRRWIAKVGTHEDTVYPIYQTTALGLLQLKQSSDLT